MKRIIHQIDAFADDKHKGNPAGVFWLTDELTDSQLQQIAFDAALPVTAFLKQVADNSFHIRWFTMNCEVNLCGHATVAATYWLYQQHGIKEMHYQSKSGPLRAGITADGKVEMDFPAQRTTLCNPTEKQLIEETLGLKVKSCYFGFEDYLVELESSAAVANYVPDFEKIKQVDCRGIILTSWDQHYGYSCVSRFFCPRVAIDEDQVCVSAHCKILPYWQAKNNSTYLHAWQASPNSGELELYALENNRVRIRASAKVRASLVLVDKLLT